MQLNLAGHVLIYTQNKDDFLEQIPEYFSINYD